eukprot:scaffold2429_cov165-Amphora_coffeaeformis.AAC.8
MRVHEGMYAVGQFSVDDTQHLVENSFIPQGYRVVVTGHSLGAGVACLIVFLRARILSLGKEQDGQLRLRVWAFATPPCLDFSACLAMQDFCTSIVNNTDCIPRASVQNLVNLNRLFCKVNDKLVEQGRSPTDWRTAKAFLRELDKIDQETLMTPEELLEVEARIVAAETGGQDGALFLPGRTLVLWESDGKF